MAHSGKNTAPNATFEFDGERYRQASAHQEEWGTRLIAELSLRGDKRILDVGCGDDVLTAQLADCVPRRHVLGIDSSTGMLETARTNTRDNLSFTLLDVTTADFDGRFRRRNFERDAPLDQGPCEVVENPAPRA